MASSYNGWPASPDPNAIGINKNFQVLGAKFPGGMKSGDVSTVFNYLIYNLHHRVEPMISGEGLSIGYGCWGYSYRANVNNPSTLSCHASGTAIDYNATKHPNGTRTTASGGGGWSASQYQTIQKILQELSGCIRWLSGNDPMHFEIYGTATQVANAVKRLNITAAPGPKPPTGDWFDMATKNDLAAVVWEQINRPEFLDAVATQVWTKTISDRKANDLLNAAGVNAEWASRGVAELPTNIWTKTLSDEQANDLLIRAAGPKD